MGKKSSGDRFLGATVHIKCKIEGEPAEFLLELKRRGIVSSAREAVVQGIICLREKVLQRGLQMVQLEAFRRPNEEI